MTTGDDKVCLFKAIWTNSSVLDVSPSAEHQIGSSASAYYQYYIADDGTRGDIDYPVKGGWIISPIDPNVSAWRDATTGSPTLSTANYWATLGKFTTGSKSENVVTDAVDLGDGLWIVGGDGADADATWQHFIDDDEGSPTNGRFGHISTLEGVIYAFGAFWIGRNSTPTTTATVFQDSLKTIVFPGGRVDAGWNAIKLDLGNATTDVDFTTITHIGRGRTPLRRFFDTEYEVDGTNEELDITAHGYSTGDAVEYNNQGGTETIGLTSGNEYFVRSITVDAISLYTTRAQSFAGGATGRADLTASTAGNGEEHRLTRQPDTRPDLTSTGTSGDFLADGCTFVAFRDFVLTSACELNGCALVNCHFVDMNTNTGATFDGNLVDEPSTWRGLAFLKVNTLANIQNNTFVAGPYGGHAIELTSAAGSPYTLDGNTFTGWGPTHKEFNALNDVDDPNDEIDITAHGFSTGDPIYYSDEGGTALTGLTDQTLYWVRAVTVDAISLHPTKYAADNNQNKIAISAGSNETHAIYSANAGLYNSSGAAITVNVSNGNVPTVRNSAGSSTSVVASVSVTFTQLINGTEVRVFDAVTGADIAGTESVTGNQFNFSDEQGNVVHVHFIKKDYVFIRLDSYTIPASAVSFPVVQQFDRNYSNP